jgi:hypothetical protein
MPPSYRDPTLTLYLMVMPAITFHLRSDQGPRRYTGIQASSVEVYTLSRDFPLARLPFRYLAS